MARRADREGGGAERDRAVGGRPIRAAGCVLWRRAAGGGIELALVHRPKWGDWSFPKGKLKAGEDARRGALREVLEETGMTCATGPELPTVRYRVGTRPKEVRYWAAEATGGGFVPNKEVDRLRWAAPETARALLTQDRDRELVAVLLGVLRPADGAAGGGG
ncbi:NUDIX hydrolase [Streptomyces sp. RS10V-4]|uniref:NUDIX hydrolase n=1 Tax=Streptomyces rhizoryzae TaxID=2932493 RepID=UPI0020067CB1|nr:NUDIX hydrolase [Streptomyces rhizoryzae]MCK7624615.1 NUDIX hydrolase [Streptomyces rhizoryzae]